MKIIYLSEGPCPATPQEWCPVSTIPLVIPCTALPTEQPRDQPAPVRAEAATVRASGWSLTWAATALGSSWRYSSCSSPFSLCRRSSIQQVGRVSVLRSIYYSDTTLKERGPKYQLMFFSSALYSELWDLIFTTFQILLLEEERKKWDFSTNFFHFKF